MKPFPLLAVSLLLFASAARAQTAVPAGGAALLADGMASFRLTTMAGNSDAASLATVDLSDAPIPRAWRLETKRDLTPAWAVEMRAPFARASARGAVALVHFHARALTATDETGAGRLRVAIQQASPNYAKSLDTQVTVGSAWQEFFIPFTFSGNYETGAAEITFGVGYKRQTLEIGGVEVLLYGDTVPLSALPRTRFTYEGRAPDAPWRREALARIEEIRKGAFSIHVVDAAGAPVAGASVRVEQRRSAFQFGTAVQFTRLLNDTPDNLRYREKILELFNAASPENELKWPVWLGEWGDGYSREQTLAGLRWLREHELPTRGHVLVWPSWKNLPKKIGALRGTKDEASIPRLVLDHIKEITAATRGSLAEWDVLNEPYDNHDLMALFGPESMTDWFRAAHAALPDAPLYLNDYGNHDMLGEAAHFKNFYRNVIFLQRAGAPLGGLGVQGHIGAQPTPPEQVLATFDLYATFKLPVRITEFDVTTDDEELQADYTRDFLTLCFSHPSLVGVQLWGFWEKAHWRPNAAMFRADWSEKPNAKVYRDLVLNQWRTRGSGTTGPDGSFAARGFHGDYVATVEIDGRRREQAFRLRPGAETAVVKIAAP